MPYGAKILVNIGSGNGLLPDGTKPLPEPMFTIRQWCFVEFPWGQFCSNCPRYLFDRSFKITNFTVQPYLPEANELS